ncbi:histidine kinase [uncultured Salegentibacter sp.]|uniref:tetratricopeptide repeat-containing sensor histidine kinase n=1 Tax=uncultured Salegentibacter sp. TaxID=259320 RepID=UPI002599FC31|nr:histidine kinase [uncultured Salegentibacter sp.]
MHYFTKFIIVLFFNLLFTFSYGIQQNPKDFKSIDSLIQNRALEKAKEESFQIIRKQPKNFQTVGRAHIYLGKINLLQGELDIALSNYMDAKKHLELLSETDRVELFSGIGIVYSRSKNFNSAEESFKKALLGYKNNDFWRLKTLVNLGGVYMEKNDPKVIKVYKEALQLAKEIEQPKVEVVILTNLSNQYIKESQWQLAINTTNKSLRIRDSLQMPLSVITYNNLGYALVNSGKVPEGINYYEKALAKASSQELQQLFYNLQNAYINIKDYEKGIDYYNRYDSIKDQIAEKRYEEKIAAIKTFYDTAEKERKIANLEAEKKAHNKKITWLIFGGGIFFLLILTIIFFRINHLKTKQALQQSQLRSKFLRLQLNPHFLFNALQQVQYYIYKNEPNTSMQYLDNFSKLIRLILEHSDEEYINLTDELEILSNYLELQKTPENQGISYRIIYKDVHDPETIKIPVMLLQPFVENAVIHGARQNRENGKVKLLFRQDVKKKVLYIEIVDNGKGIQTDRSQDHKKLHRSMGREILKNRVEEFNKMNKSHIVLNVERACNDKAFPGTKVTLTVPYLEF